MRLSDAQLNLLAEIQSGEARYVKAQSRWYRTLSVLEREGLVVASAVIGGGLWYENEITAAGIDALDSVGVEVDQ